MNFPITVSVLLLCLPIVNAGEPIVRFSSSSNSTQLIELYTSQGCSSCPPAQKWLNKLQHHPQIWHTLFPVAFHVDYWDYIGWSDRYARSEFSARQQRYQKQGLSQAVYTPGFFINGNEWRGWFAHLELPQDGNNTGKLSARITPLSASIEFTSQGERVEKVILNRAILGFDLSTYVEAGENAEVRLDEDFVVLDFHQYESDGSSWQIPIYAPAFKADRYAIVLWVTIENQLELLQVTGGWLPELFFEK